MRDKTNSLDQYIDLFDANRELIEQVSPRVLNRLRDEAYNLLRSARLPERGDEGYEKTSVNQMFAPDYGINLARVNMPVDIAATFRCDIPNMSTLLGIMANDTFVPTNTLLGNLPHGVVITPFSKADPEMTVVIERYLGQIVPAGDTVVALNTLLATDGLLIHIGRGVNVGRPIQLVNILAAASPYMAVRRVLIVAEDDSRADFLVCDHTQGEDNYMMNCEIVEVYVGRGANISFVSMEESSKRTSRVAGVYVRQEGHSRYDATYATLLNGVTRNDLYIDIVGEHAEAYLNGMAIGSGVQHIDNCSNVNHRCGRSRSNQNFRYVLDQQAVGAFEGGIEVFAGAAGTEAYQSNGNILASSDARVHTKPRLLIYNDDVKCSHGASTGQLDENALFYMQTRGISRQEARTMLMQAFVSGVIDNIRPVAVGDRLRHLVEKRFAGTLATCHECQAGCDRSPHI